MQNDNRSITNTLIADWQAAGMRPSRTPVLETWTVRLDSYPGRLPHVLLGRLRFPRQSSHLLMELMTSIHHCKTAPNGRLPFKTTRSKPKAPC